MRAPHAVPTILAAIAVAMVGAMVSGPAPAQEAPQPKAYKPVAIELPQQIEDPSHVTFRRQIVEIAKRKDRAALAKHVARSFFWIVEGKDVADKSRAGIDNLARAIGLDAADADGWESLAAFASEASGDPDPQRPGVICAPGDPKYDPAAAEALAKLTGTTASAWYYPVADGIDVRGGMTADSKVIGKLGLHFTWVHPDDSPAAAVRSDVVRIVLPSGQFGFVSVDSLAPLPADLLCYRKDGNGWSIAGIVGGDPPAQ